MDCKVQEWERVQVALFDTQAEAWGLAEAISREFHVPAGVQDCQDETWVATCPSGVDLASIGFFVRGWFAARRYQP